jgi:hypothetical protein
MRSSDTLLIFHHYRYALIKAVTDAKYRGHCLFLELMTTMEQTSNDAFLFQASSLDAAETRLGHIGDYIFLLPVASCL